MDAPGAYETGLFTNAAFAGADELDEVLDFRQRRQFLFNFLQRVGQDQAFAKNQLVRLAQGVLCLLGDAVAFQADFIDGHWRGRVAVGEHEWRDILPYRAAGANHRIFPDAAKLMHRCKAG